MQYYFSTTTIRWLSCFEGPLAKRNWALRLVAWQKLASLLRRAAKRCCKAETGFLSDQYVKKFVVRVILVHFFKKIEKFQIFAVGRFYHTAASVADLNCFIAIGADLCQVVN